MTIEPVGPDDQSDDELAGRAAPADETESIAPQPAETKTVPARPVRTTEGPGTVIGRYKLLQQIGEGGFGAVYMAEQKHPVKRKVALKIIKLGMDTKQVIARFEAERQALAMMDHPNIARVLDAGATETGRPFFVMELVKGVPFTEYCDTESLPTRDRALLFVDVCHAVQHAHQKGIIHRDLKPSNVMITLHDGKPVPKVIDFGIAKATNRELTDKTLFTEYHQLIGTPAYMSPEQAEMSGLDLDTRSDIYSLGVLLYELLTGTTPFDSRRFRGMGLAEIQRVIREEEPHKPSTRVSEMSRGRFTPDNGKTKDATRKTSIQYITKHRRTDMVGLRREISGDLDWIIMKCLEKDRSRRYETATGLARDVERFLNDEPVSAGRPGAGYRLRKWIRRHKGSFVTAVLVLLLLVGGVIVSNKARVEAARERDVAIQARAEAARERDDAILARKQSGAVVDFLSNMLGAVDPTKGKGHDITVREVLDEAAKKASAELKDQPEVEAAVRHTIGVTYSNLGLGEAAEEHLRKSLEIRRRSDDTERLEVATTLRHLALLVVYKDGIDTSLEMLGEAKAIREKLLGADDPVTLEILADIERLRVQREPFPEDLRLFGEAAQKILGMPGDSDAIEAQTEEMLSQVRHLCSAGEHASARRVIRAYCAPIIEQLGEVSVVPDMLGFLGMQRLRKDDFVTAEPLYREALELSRRFLGKNHPDVSKNLRSLGEVLLRKGDPGAAVRLAREALAIDRELFGNEHLNVADSLYLLGGALLNDGENAQAEPVLREALAIRRELLGEDHSNNPDDLNDYAWGLLTCELEDLRDPQGALPVAKRAVEMSAGEDANILDTLALAYFMTGDTAKAIETQEKAILLLPPGESIRRTKLEANLAKYRQAVAAESRD